MKRNTFCYVYCNTWRKIASFNFHLRAKSMFNTLNCVTFYIICCNEFSICWFFFLQSLQKHFTFIKKIRYFAMKIIHRPYAVCIWHIKTYLSVSNLFLLLYSTFFFTFHLHLGCLFMSLNCISFSDRYFDSILLKLTHVFTGICLRIKYQIMNWVLYMEYHCVCMMKKKKKFVWDKNSKLIFDPG